MQHNQCLNTLHEKRTTKHSVSSRNYIIRLVIYWHGQNSVISSGQNITTSETVSEFISFRSRVTLDT